MSNDFQNNSSWVHVWKYNMQHSKTELSAIIKSLSTAELQRAETFVHTNDKRRYLLAHCFLRDVLSKFLNCNTCDVEFFNGVNQKPFLRQKANENAIYFNLSYRDNYALLAISNAECLGIDVEKTRAIENVKPFLNDYFSKEEQIKIGQAENETDRSALLFRFWTMKEAVIKALGIGFSQPLTAYNLSDFLSVNTMLPGFDKKHVWQIHDIKMEENYKAAIAVKADKVDLAFFDY